MSRMQSNPGSKVGSACLLMFAIFWLGFSVVWTVIAYLGSDGGWGWLFGIPFILIGLFLLGRMIFGVLGRMRVGRPELDISNPTPRPGEQVSVSYRQPLKTTTEVTHFSMELIFQESATYSQGTDSITKTHEKVVDYFDSPGRTYQAGELLRDTYQFQIPLDGMHTFEATNNKLRWFVRVKVDIANWPNYTEDFPLRVLPGEGW